VLGVIYVSIAYYITDMPIEWIRIGKFSIICYLIGLTSESLGLAISSQLNVVVSYPFIISNVLLLLFWLGDFNQGGYQSETSLAKEIAKVECKGHPLGKFSLAKNSWLKGLL
jgi:hypothetical protein